MLRLTRLPEEVTRLLAPLKPYFSYRHYLVFCWLLVAHLVCYEKATLQALARYIPGHVGHLRCSLSAHLAAGEGRSAITGRETRRGPREE